MRGSTGLCGSAASAIPNFRIVRLRMPTAEGRFTFAGPAALESAGDAELWLRFRMTFSLGSKT